MKFLTLCLFFTSCSQSDTPAALISFYAGNRLPFIQQMIHPFPVGFDTVLLNLPPLKKNYQVLKGDSFYTLGDSAVRGVILQQADHKDTLAWVIWEDKIVLDQTLLLSMFQYEPEICLRLGKYFFLNDSLSFADELLKVGEQAEMAEAYYYRGKIAEKNWQFTSALAFCQKAYQLGYDYAIVDIQFQMAMLGRRDEAIPLLKDAADKGNTDAMLALGEMYDPINLLTGYRMPEDATDTTALFWYKKAYKEGKARGAYLAGQIFHLAFFDDIPDPHSIDSALFWWNRAAESGNYSGMMALAMSYIQCEPPVTDSLPDCNAMQEKAMRLFEEGVQINPENTYFILGSFYEKGKGFPRDYRKALEYYDKASALGLEGAARYAREIRAKLSAQDTPKVDWKQKD